ncbi:flagellin [Anaerobiospirillum sp. NML120449]|uniref:flagellin N-terminal helical domain-containing protein n=1 Tax=Anaerobiospirillum sp. NML120449 TaxID=2932817 RepID=UPI00248ADCBD|nr:flagellin [Anaerobiospirillum sp. NML120449]
MAVYVNTNVSSLNGRRYLNNVQNQLTTTYQRLSSGMRINSAKDDAAGLQISSRLTTQINGLNQGNRNAADGIALAQTIEGAMDETTAMLQKIRTLAVQSVNGTNTAEDRAALKKEADALGAEIDRIAEKTTFGGKTILAGGDTGTLYDAANGSDKTKGVLSLQVGANSGDTISFEVNNMRMSQIVERVKGQTANADIWTAANGFKMGTADEASKMIAHIDAMIADADGQRAGLGAIQNNRHPLWC